MRVQSCLFAKRKKPSHLSIEGLFEFNPGNDLVSHKVALAVPSALRGLTSVFGMGTGVTLSVRSPETCYRIRELQISQSENFGILDNSILMGKATSAQTCNEN